LFNGIKQIPDTTLFSAQNLLESGGRAVRLLTAISQSQETQLSLTNRALRFEVSQGHIIWYHSTQ